MNKRYRKAVIAANWKMNKTAGEVRQYASDLRAALPRSKWCEVVMCVPHIALPAMVRAAKTHRLEPGAQNCSSFEQGAYTGEISAAMLAECGAKYVIIGHSERRQHFFETDSDVCKKVGLALEHGLRPIVCIGESEAQRRTNVTYEHLRMQLKQALYEVGAEKMRKVVIAYEPIWAIGTGNTATSEQANEAGQAIRECLRGLYGARVARAIPILYGGSVNPSNAYELFSMPDVDGALVGGASLDASDFAQIIKAADQQG